MNDAAVEAAERQEALRAELAVVSEHVPRQAGTFKSIREYSHLAEERHWTQRWDPVRRELSDEPVAMKGMVWSAAIEQSLKEQNGVSIPAMPEPLYLDRSIVVKTAG